MRAPRIYIDYNNRDVDGCVRLNTVGSKEDIERYGDSLRSGMLVVLYDEEFEYDAVLDFEESIGLWKARILDITPREDLR